MTLEQLNIGEKAIIKSINCEPSLKNRFYSFGIVKGATICVEEVTLTKSTIEIKINNTKVALRIKEASTIEVDKCS